MTLLTQTRRLGIPVPTVHLSTGLWPHLGSTPSLCAHCSASTHRIPGDQGPSPPAHLSDTGLRVFALPSCAGRTFRVFPSPVLGGAGASEPQPWLSLCQLWPCRGLGTGCSRRTSTTSPSHRLHHISAISDRVQVDMPLICQVLTAHPWFYKKLAQITMTVSIPDKEDLIVWLV